MRKNIFILAAILLIGLLLRTLFINISPASIYGDELTITLDVNSLLKTGRDQLGNLLPLTFPMGAGRPAGYVYGSIPFIALFGPTALGVRALSIISGLGIIFLLYFAGRKFFSEKFGLIAAGITAVSQWDISLSRGGFEAHFALFLALFGTYLFLKAKDKPLFYIISALSFGLTLHTYPTYKISLLFFLPLLFWFRRPVWTKYLTLGVLIFVISGFLALSQTFFGGSEKRFSDINIFSQGELKNRIEQKIILERQISLLPKELSKYLHNKPLEYSKAFIENYLQNFSLDFLVLHGDRNPRHNMATMGMIYFAQSILIIAGLFAYFQKERRLILFLIFWILLVPVPSAIVDLPHALRSSFMLPPLVFLSALGFLNIVNYRSKIFLYAVLTLFVIQFVFFVQKLYFLSPNEYSNFWSYPAKLASDIAAESKDKYNFVIISDRIDDIEFAYPVYSKTDAKEVIAQNREKSNLAGYKFKKFDNVYIGYIPDAKLQKFLENLNSSVLFIGPPSTKDYLSDYELVEGKNKQQALIVKKI